MALYKPATKVTSVPFPYLALVTRSDPDFERKKHREVEYAFSSKVFLNDPYTSGPYSRKTNVYQVGQPSGGLDPLITAALAPTVGNAVPGLYVGTPDGNGWA